MSPTKTSKFRELWSPAFLTLKSNCLGCNHNGLVPIIVLSVKCFFFSIATFQICRSNVTVKVTLIKNFGMNGNASPQGMYMLNTKALPLTLSNDSKVTTNVKVFRHLGKRSWSRSQGENFWYEQKGLITRNVHVKYESPTTNGSKVIANVKVFRYVGQRSR